MRAEPTGNDCACFCAGKDQSWGRYCQVRRSLGPHIAVRLRIIFSKRTDASSLVDAGLQSRCSID